MEKTKASFQDLVTLVDTSNQNMIKEFMEEKYPDHALLGEEDVEWGHDYEVYMVWCIFCRLSMQFLTRNGFGL